MIIVMKKSATDGQIDPGRRVDRVGRVPGPSVRGDGEDGSIGAVGDARSREQIKSVAHPGGVGDRCSHSQAYKLASPNSGKPDTIVRRGGRG